MKDEVSENQPVEGEEGTTFDNSYPDYRRESKLFDMTHLGQRRCAVCGTPLLSPYDFHGFNVLFCTKDNKPVCRICRYPSLELLSANAIHCTNEKCAAYQVITHTKDNGENKNNEPTAGTKKTP